MRARGPERVLFVCARNAGRSQMATAFFNASADPTRALATSAGLGAAPSVYPEVVTVMKEVGIDLSELVPTELNARMLTEATFVVTLGCGERVPLIPEGRRADWMLPDPADLPLARVREIRDEIRALVDALIRDRTWAQ